jgi:hypothetical protein
LIPRYFISSAKERTVNIFLFYFQTDKWFFIPLYLADRYQHQFGNITCMVCWITPTIIRRTKIPYAKEELQKLTGEQKNTTRVALVPKLSPTQTKLVNINVEVIMFYYKFMSLRVIITWIIYLALQTFKKDTLILQRHKVKIFLTSLPYKSIINFISQTLLLFTQHSNHWKHM